MSDIRAYCNPHPRYREQESRLTGEIYTEDRKGTVIDALIKSLRKGDVIQVLEMGLLAPTVGRPTTRREALADRVERIKARGASILEVSTGHTSRNGHLPRMMLRASEFIAHSGRVRKSDRAGRPKIAITPEQDELGEGLWRSRRFKTDKERLAAVNKRLGIVPLLKRGWCWSRWGSPHATQA